MLIFLISNNQNSIGIQLIHNAMAPATIYYNQTHNISKITALNEGKGILWLAEVDFNQ